MRDEEREQEVLMKWLELQHPEAFQKTHHSPNGGLRHKAIAAKLKRMGTKPGFPDLVMFEPRGKFCGLVIEFKSIKGVKPTQKQFDWLEILAASGFKATWCKGIDAAMRTINEYLMGSEQ